MAKKKIQWRKQASISKGPWRRARYDKCLQVDVCLFLALEVSISEFNLMQQVQEAGEGTHGAEPAMSKKQ